ncbi:MAG TPA: CAP domain-containing protein [Candidatus Angelobacter sp.]
MKRIGIPIAVQALVLVGAAQAPSVPSLSPEQQLFKLLNMVRANAGVQTLQWDPKVAQAALAHAQKLAEHADLSHRFAGELELDQRLGATGVRFNAVAENVALADTVEEAHLALMNSPGHRANIMNPQYNAVGIAVVQRNRSLYVTQDFARLLPTYSEQQFRDAIVAEFNRLRQVHRSGPIDTRPDPRLDQEACSGKLDPGEVLQGLTGATRAAVFSATQPVDLPPPMDQAAADFTLRRMNIGVCFRADTKDGFSKFWVVAAFFPGK